MYCKQCTQPNLTRPSLDAFHPLGLLSRACPVPQTKPFICNNINSFSPYAKANVHRMFAVRRMFAFAYGENEFMLLQMKGLVWGTGQALLRSPRGRNASRDGLVKLGWVHCLQYTLNCFQYNVCGLCRCEPSNHQLTLHNDIWKSSISIGLKACKFKSSLLSHHSWSAVYCN